MTNGDLSVAVLDTSALLALVREESGATRVEGAVRRGALISTVNWAEALSRMAVGGESVDVSAPRIRRVIGKVGTLDLVPFDEVQAEQTARLRVPRNPSASRWQTERVWRSVASIDSRC